MAHITDTTKKNFFYMVLLLTTLGALYTLKSYVPVILLALMFSTMVAPIFIFIRKYLKSTTLSSLITIFISFLIIFIPVFFSFNLFIKEATNFRDSVAFDTQTFEKNLNTQLKDFYTITNEIPILGESINPKSVSTAIKDGAKNASSFLVSQAVKIGSSSVVFIANFLIFIILVFFITPSLPRMRKYMEKLSPLNNEIDSLYISRTVTMVSTTIKGTFIVAIVQALASGFFLWLAGIDYVLTLMLALMFASIIPLLGTASINIPIVLYLFLIGQPVQALILLLGHIIIVSNIDNLLRAELVSRETSLHPAITLVSILGGLQMFGFWGFIYGPIAMILFLTSLEVYQKHYQK